MNTGKTTGFRERELALLVAMAFGLSACGGGSGGGIRPTNPPPPPPPASPPAAPAPARPPSDAQLSLTNAYQAQNQGFTGAGVTIGVVDTGITRNHPSLSGRVQKELIYVDPNANNTSVDDVVGHGTWVSEIAAGKPFANFAGGIAPGAGLVSARIISDMEPVDDGSGQGNAVTADDAQFFAQTLNPALINAGVDVMNNSWGGIYWDTSQASINNAFASAYEPFVLQHGGLVVFAAGNDSRSDPSDIAALPSLAPQLEKGWLVAVAVDSNHPDQLADYSNACGKAMNYCLAAPGDVIVSDKDATASNSSNYVIVEGTSFAAPEVSGAAALVWEAYPYFDNDLVRQTLLGTADDLGATGPDAVFGYGALNVGRAVNGPGKFDWGDVSVSFDGATSTWSNDIVGAGGLSKSGSGTLVLAGDDTYEGDTNVFGGTLQSAHALPGNTSVASGAALTGIYDATNTSVVPVGVPGVAGDLSNAGRVLVAGGNAAIGGNYRQTANGTLSLSLGSMLDVSGTATLAGQLNIVGADQGYIRNAHQDLLTAGGGVLGTFDTFTLASGVFLASTVQYDVNAVWIDTSSLSVTATAKSAGFGAQPLVMGSAQRLDGAFGQINASRSGSGAVSSGFISAAGAIQHTPTLAAAKLSLQSLSGELHAASAAMAFQSIDASSRTLSDRFDQLMNHGRYGTWTQQLDVSGAMARSGFDGVGFQLDGWLIGSDRRVGTHGVAGFAFGQSEGYQRLEQRLDHDRSRSTEAMLYAGWMRGDAYTQGRIGFGHFRQDINRSLLLGLRQMPVSTDYSGQYMVAYGESGLHLRQGRSQLTPYMNLEYARVGRDGFAEQGAYGFGLQSPAQTTARWQAGVGVRALHHVDFSSGPSVDFTARVQWQNTLASSGDAFNASFVGVQDWRPLYGVGLSRYSGLFGVGVKAHLNPKATLNVGYDYQIGQRVKTKQAMARFELAF